MANRDNPMGFIPVGRLDGSEIPVRRFAADASKSLAVFIGDGIAAENDGAAIAAIANCGAIFLGACVGVYDSNGVPCGAPNSLVSTKYLPAASAGYVDVALALPDSIFKIQALTGVTPAATDVFNCSDHTAGTGDTTTGRSKHELTGSFSTANQFKLIGKVDEPGNAWGEHVDVLVVAQESYWFTGAAGV